MGKKLSASEIARYEEDDMRAMFRLGLIGLFLSLVLAGCADSGTGSDNDKRGVFYGGVTGGHAWP
jgi:hypothetical protein